MGPVQFLCLFPNMTHTIYAFMLTNIDTCSVQNMLWKSSEYLNLDASDIVTIIDTNEYILGTMLGTVKTHKMH